MSEKPRIGIATAHTEYDGEQIAWAFRANVEPVTLAGGLPLLLPILAPDLAEDLLATVDGLVLTGGGDVGPDRYGEAPVEEVYSVDPARDEWELALMKAARAVPQGPSGHGLPVLAICRGAQILNVAAGGTLIQHLPAVTPGPHRLRDRGNESVHTVKIAADSQLSEIVGSSPLGVNSIHHQAIATVGPGLRAVAWAPDGVVEAVERVDRGPVIAVQWHPEWLIHRRRQQKLYRWLIATAANGRSELVRSQAYSPDSFAAHVVHRPLKDSA